MNTQNATAAANCMTRDLTGVTNPTQGLYTFSPSHLPEHCHVTEIRLGLSVVARYITHETGVGAAIDKPTYAPILAPMFQDILEWLWEPTS